MNNYAQNYGRGSQRGFQRSLISPFLMREIEWRIFNDSSSREEMLSLLQNRLKISEYDAKKLLYEVSRLVNVECFPPIIRLELILTEACNLMCTYCFERAIRKPRRMPKPTIARAIDFLFDYSGDKKDLFITLFGGEPTLNFSGMEYAVRYASINAKKTGKRVRFNITTNGTLIDDRTVKLFDQYDISVLLSVDGVGASHDRHRVDRRGLGTFNRVKEALQKLKTANFWVGVRMTVTPQNVKELCDNVVGLHSLGANEFLIGRATGVDWTKEEMIRYFTQMQMVLRWRRQRRPENFIIHHMTEPEIEGNIFGCRAGRSSVTITPDGIISPCARIHALSKEAPIAALGDLEVGLVDLATRYDLVDCSKMKSFWSASPLSSKRYPGGCFATNFEETGNLHQPSVQNYRFSLVEERLRKSWRRYEPED